MSANKLNYFKKGDFWYTLLFCISLFVAVVIFFSLSFKSSGLFDKEQAAVQVLMQELSNGSIEQVSLVRLPDEVLFERSQSDIEEQSVIPKDIQTKILESEDETVVEEIKFNVVKKTQLSPGRDYEESILYLGDKKIAKQKIVAGKIVMQKGDIPDGRVRIYNEYDNTYGEEEYKNGKRHGTGKMYYHDGQIKYEFNYEDGDLITSKEFYTNGILRFEADYRDALDLPNESEVGIGKMYFKNGQLMYEWNMTKTLKKGFKKAYSQSGELVEELYFNSKGELIEQRK